MPQRKKSERKTAYIEKLKHKYEQDQRKEDKPKTKRIEELKKKNPD